jgi:hypothetical protein
VAHLHSLAEPTSAAAVVVLALTQLMEVTAVQELSFFVMQILSQT